MPKLDKNLNKMKCLSGIVSLVFMTGNKKKCHLKKASLRIKQIALLESVMRILMIVKIGPTQFEFLHAG